MHRAYVVSELCRPLLAKRKPYDEAITNLRRVCIDALVDTVDAFLKLQNLMVFARTSWVAVHRSLGSALLLGILKEPAKSESVRLMLDQLVTVMSNLEYADASEMPAPLARAVEALQMLNVAGASSEEDSPAGTGSGETTQSWSPHAEMQRILWGADFTTTRSSWELGSDGVADDYSGLSRGKNRI